MSINKYLVFEKPQIFSTHFYPMMAIADDSFNEVDWDLIAKIVPEFRPIVLENGITEAMDMFTAAYQEELAEDEIGAMTQLALLMLARSFKCEVC